MDAFNFERFDMTKPPIRTRWFLRPLTWLLSVPSTISHRTRITKTGTDGLKAPYLMLCNHNSFMDFKVLTKAVFPQRCNYVVAIDGFIGREWLLRNVGGICKRKFTNDLRLIKQLHQVIDNGDVAVIYPEARYSLCGTTAILPESLGKFCKHLGVPVVTFICHGNHVTAPFWNIHERKIRPTEAEMTLLFTPEQLKAASAEEINASLVEAFQYDDFAWQKARGLKTKYKKRAEGLHKVLYQCPACKTEFRMNSSEDRLFCEACGKTWIMDETGQLSASEGGTEFPHIPDWYEWERANVRAEVEAGTYTSGVLDVHVDSLPNAKGYVRLGNGTMVHDYNGFRVAGKDEQGRDFSMEIPVPDLYSVHIEYEYLGKYGDCVDLNTIRDTWYVYPHGKDFAITKMALATEELYKKNKRDAGKECKPGLA